MLGRRSWQRRRRFHSRACAFLRDLGFEAYARVDSSQRPLSGERQRMWMVGRCGADGARGWRFAKLVRGNERGGCGGCDERARAIGPTREKRRAKARQYKKQQRKDADWDFGGSGA